MTLERGKSMAESIYKVIELVGTSATSWEEAAKNAVELAGSHCRNCASPRYRTWT